MSEWSVDGKQKKRTRRSMKNKNMISNFKVMFNNMRGYKMKKETLRHIIQEEKPVVIGIAETNLEEDEIIEEIEGYKIKRKDRRQKGGGVMMIYREALESMVVEEEELGGDEALWMTVKNQNIKIRIGVVYMPQENKTSATELKRIYKQIGKEVEKATMENASVILMGDFNAKIGDEDNEEGASKGGKILMEMVQKQDLYVVNTDERCRGKWTRILGDEKSVLDYMMIKNDDKPYIQGMEIDENKNMTPYWVTREENPRTIYADHCMMRLIIDWKMMLVDTANNRKFMGKKEYGNFTKEINEKRVSKILEMEGEFKEAYTKWSTTVMQIAERNSKKRKKRQTWKVNRLLRKAKKIMVKKQKVGNLSREERRLMKVQKTLIDEHIWNEIMSRKRAQIEKTVDDMKKKGEAGDGLWDVRNKIIGRKREGKHAIEDENGVIQREEEQIKTVYEKYFKKLLGKDQRCEGKHGEETEEHVERVMKSMEIIANQKDGKPVDKELVKETIRELKPKKSADRDGWKNELVKMGGEEMERSIHIISERVIGGMQIPNEFNLMTILATHKKNSKLKMKNKRGLFLTNVISKIVERIVKKRNVEEREKNSNEMQNGGRKKRAPVDNQMMVWSIIKRNKYLCQDTYLVFIDMEKCFDKIWLEDGIIELWKEGTDVKDAVVIKKMNEVSVATIRTPVGETKAIELKNIVRQGTVSGPDICCSSTGAVNRMGRKLVTMYGPWIEIGAPVYVDDITIATDINMANDLLYNCSLLEERKKMTVNTEPEKSGCLRIEGGEHPEEELTRAVKNGWIRRLKEYELLGTWMNEGGNYFTAVEKMKKKLPLMAIMTKQIGNKNIVGRYALTARIKLVEAVCMKGLLYGAEAVPNLEEEMEELEKIQHKLLCDLVGLPVSTPRMPLLMELGLWTMKHKIQYKKLMLYHNVLVSNEGIAIWGRGGAKSGRRNGGTGKNPAQAVV